MLTSIGVFGIVDVDCARPYSSCAKLAVVGDEPQDFVGEAGHRKQTPRLPVRQPRRLQYRALHNLCFRLLEYAGRPRRL